MAFSLKSHCIFRDKAMVPFIFIVLGLQLHLICEYSFSYSLFLYIYCCSCHYPTIALYKSFLRTSN